jgi:hypothetical protein
MTITIMNRLIGAVVCWVSRLRAATLRLMRAFDRSPSR